MRKLVWASIATLLCLVSAPMAHSAPEAIAPVAIEEMTWVEVRDAIKAGRTTVILPVGGTEQNGPQMAIGKHNVIVKYTAEEIARRLGNALVAPVVAYVPEGDIEPPTGHMRFPGTITLPAEHFIKLIEYACRSFKAHGFRDVILIGDHGSYQKDLKTVAGALTAEWKGSGVRVHFIPQYYNENGFTAWLQSQGASKEEIGPHASTTDTSQLLALDPKLVRMDKLGEFGPESGVQGDPRGATVAFGRKGLDMKIEAALASIRKVVEAASR